MKKIILILLILFAKIVLCQTTNYAVSNNISLAIAPNKIFNSNDGNLLLTNGEINVDNGLANIMKVKPNGDTVYIKSINDLEIYLTSSGNFYTNYKPIDPVLINVGYLNAVSYLTLYDRNSNIMWQKDMSNEGPYGGIANYANPPLVHDMIELNPNKYLFSLTAFTPTMFPVPLNAGDFFIEIDSLGNTLSSTNLVDGKNYSFIGKLNNSVYCVSNGYSYVYGDFNKKNTITKYNYITKDYYDIFFQYDLINNLASIDINAATLLPSNKIIVGGRTFFQNEKYGTIVCMDTIGNILWNKNIVPTNLYADNAILDIKYFNSKIFCHYKTDSSSFTLQFDTVGNLISTTNNNILCSDLTQLNNNFYYNGSLSNSPYNLFLLKTDSIGTSNCSSTYSLNTLSPFIINTGQSFGQLTNTVFTPQSISNSATNLTYSIYTNYGCGINMNLPDNEINKKISFYPNPVINSFKICTEGIEFDKIKIFNIQGEVVEIINTGNNENISVTNLCNGIYFCEIIHRGIKILTKKIIINH